MGKRIGVALLALGIAAVLAVTALDRAPAGRQPGAGRSARPSQVQPQSNRNGSSLRLVAGTGCVNGICTRYPHTRAGAVSAAVEFMTELGSTLDPDRAAAVARLAADPSYLAAAQDAAASVIAARRSLGLPSSGSLPPGTAALLVPVMYQVHDGSPDRPTVYLLFDYTLTAQSGTAEHTGVTEVRLTWTPRSWRLLSPPAHDPAALLATPGTTEAAAKGWEAMTSGL
ncbi:MAG TPA: hypothetical protein VMA95_11730 [Streptosporangiaceae bacterium]|nr:hypothetical protein [Streptosporangiaceae bacterium]